MTSQMSFNDVMMDLVKVPQLAPGPAPLPIDRDRFLEEFGEEDEDYINSPSFIRPSLLSLPPSLPAPKRPPSALNQPEPSTGFCSCLLI